MKSKPNILIFLADDLGWGDLGCYGADLIPTPAIDQLASRGVKFVDAHASAAECTPSRYSLLTGQYSWRSPLKMGVLGGSDPAIIEPNQVTIASTLSDSGYKTGAFGKWHLGLNWLGLDGNRRTAFDTEEFDSNPRSEGRDIDYSRPFTQGPIDHGFDEFFGISGSLDMPPYCFLHQDHTIGIPNHEKVELVGSQRAGLQVQDWQDDQVDVEVVATARKWISESVSADQPFFAYIASAAPHRPCVPPAFIRGRSRAGIRGDAVCLVDWMVGSIVEELEKHDALENTIFIFSSDNGAPIIWGAEEGVPDHRPNGGWRGEKSDAWEGGHRIPLIIAGGGVSPYATIETPVSLMDILPTIVEITSDREISTLQDGESLVEFLFPSGAPTELSDPEDARIFAQQSHDGTLALRKGQDKAIFGTGSGGIWSQPSGHRVRPDSSEGQFYKLDSDPTESDNLWQSSQPKASEMYQAFAKATGYEQITRGLPE